MIGELWGCLLNIQNWAPSSEFVSSIIPSWQILTAHAQPFRWARDLAFCLKVPLVSLLVWASSGGSGETARMRRLARTFAARIGDKYQIRLTRPNWWLSSGLGRMSVQGDFNLFTPVRVGLSMRSIATTYVTYKRRNGAFHLTTLQKDPIQSCVNTLLIWCHVWCVGCSLSTK